MDPQNHQFIKKPRPTQLTNKIKKFLAEFPLLFYSYRIDFLINLARFAKWRKRRFTGPYLADDISVNRYIVDKYLADGPICLFEFGVFEGRTMKHWLEAHPHAESRFFGFDSFEGLPEKWEVFSTELRPGTFTTAGKIPQLDDPRVQFIKGWFQHTLPEFLKTFSPGGRRVVVHIDSDLYTSALFVLCSMHPFLVPGSIVVFNEFSYPLDEFRACEEYCASFLREYEVLAGGGEYYDQVAIKFTK